MTKEFYLSTEFITLTQLLKITHLVGSGSDAHFLITEGRVKLNGKIDTRKRAKVYKNDLVTFGDTTIKVM